MDLAVDEPETWSSLCSSAWFSYVEVYLPLAGQSSSTRRVKCILPFTGSKHIDSEPLRVLPSIVGSTVDGVSVLTEMACLVITRRIVRNWLPTLHRVCVPQVVGAEEQ
jgi:hypothetical protein